jgi:hypothetical protein
LTLDYTRVYSNQSVYNGGGSGGGIYNNTTLTISHSLIEYNTVRVLGAGLRNKGDAYILASTIANNATFSGSGGSFGGGIYNTGNISILNSTLSGNASRDGGSALHNAVGVVNAYNITVALNVHNTDLDGSDTDDAGVVNSPSGTLNVRSSIITRNYELIGGLRYNKDCHGTLGIFAQSFFMPLGFYPPSGTPVAPCVFSLGLFANAYINMRPSDLGPLANNGGPTPTHPLDPGSAAYNNAGITGCLDPYGYLLETDQRGTPRIFGGGCDAGAVEQGSAWWLFLPLGTR